MAWVWVTHMGYGYGYGYGYGFAMNNHVSGSQTLSEAMERVKRGCPSIPAVTGTGWTTGKEYNSLQMWNEASYGIDGVEGGIGSSEGVHQGTWLPEYPTTHETGACTPPEYPITPLASSRMQGEQLKRAITPTRTRHCGYGYISNLYPSLWVWTDTRGFTRSIASESV
ncbi:hypothetical protein BU15DRAFT_64787 [Melanogaster broomeanus]|nr:hypothetical protein BU15DRAFT_64787 [Melanogaster broomeanus]